MDEDGTGIRAVGAPESKKKGDLMHRIGILYGMEETFPPAFVDRINSMEAPA